MYSNSRSTTKTSNKKTIILVVIGVAALLLALFFTLEITGKTNFISLREDSTQSEDSAFDQAPTSDEIQAGDEVPIKNQDATTSNLPGTPTSGNNSSSEAESVALIISDTGEYDGNIEVSAFTPDAIANGTCTYEFTSGSETITKSNLARADASSTICIDKPFPASELSSSNEWEVTVTYQSDSGNYRGSQTTILAL